MTLSVNQILVICLVAELVVFLIILARLAVSALGLIKTAKVTMKDVQVVAGVGRNAVDECKSVVKDTAITLANNATTADKAAGIAAAVFALANYRELVRKHTFLGSGIIGAYLDKRDAKIAQKELRRTKKEVAKLRKASRKEARASRKATKLARKLRNTK